MGILWGFCCGEHEATVPTINSSDSDIELGTCGSEKEEPGREEEEREGEKERERKFEEMCGESKSVNEGVRRERKAREEAVREFYKSAPSLENPYPISDCSSSQ